VWAWQGVKPIARASELFDMRQFGDFRPFEDGDFDAFDVTLTVIMPSAVIPSGKHFDQGCGPQGSCSCVAVRTQWTATQCGPVVG
jgi:hypothetical protein